MVKIIKIAVNIARTLRKTLIILIIPRTLKSFLLAL
jgi:hypothetical protein